MNHRSACLALCIVVLSSCRNPPPGALSLRGDMVDAYQATTALYSYVWNNEQFYSDRSHKHILSLLDQLESNFHNVERDAPIEFFEPGFRVTLDTHQQMLNDIRKRFEQGSKQYAQWKLQGLATNCVSCHSRYEVPVDFLGQLPVIQDNSFDARLARAEFLIATRDFDKASDALFGLATSLSQVEGASTYLLEALKRWLVVEVRVKNRALESSQRLRALSVERTYPTSVQTLLDRWVADLAMFAERVPPAHPLLVEAQVLLEDLPTDATERDDELHLVHTLRATAILHRFLEGRPQVDSRRHASYMLANAYLHIPISTFDVFKELYLEQVVREFPFTEEAKQAYVLYREYIETTSTGSSGLHLEPEQEEKLAELKDLAFGKPQLMQRDSDRVWTY